MRLPYVPPPRSGDEKTAACAPVSVWVGEGRVTVVVGGPGSRVDARRLGGVAAACWLMPTLSRRFIAEAFGADTDE
ncbi:hypothetical protein GCM10022227_19470 [Streptomyces sedi]